MKTKLEMAHEWAIELLRAGDSSDDVISCAWRYADAMQAEADKRGKEEQDKLKQNERNYHDELVFIGLEEWQPDWSQAPEWANWWVKTMGDSYLWCMHEPIMNDDYFRAVAGSNHAPSFGYTGNWRDSLRKRPN